MRLIKRKPGTPWCANCQFRCGRGFVDFTPGEAVFMETFKRSHGYAFAGEHLIEQHSRCKRLLTLYSGLAARYRTLSCGKRQLVNIVVPGDLVGLESSLCSTSEHSIEALVDVTFCVFDPARIEELLSSSLGSRVAWSQALDERRVEARMAVIAACDGRRALASFMLDLYKRLERRRLASGGRFFLPLSRQQIGEALGLTSVHVGRILGEFQASGLMRLDGGKLHVPDLARLSEVASLDTDPAEEAPLI
jgi:CRP-like cAMP-binding protein